MAFRLLVLLGLSMAAASADEPTFDANSFEACDADKMWRYKTQVCDSFICNGSGKLESGCVLEWCQQKCHQLKIGEFAACKCP